MEIWPLLKHLRDYWRPIILVHLLFSMLGITLLAPVFGAILQGLVSLSGSAAVADQDIARVLLSPLGMLSAVFLSGLALGIAALELGALQAIAQSAMHAVPLKPLQATLSTLRHAQTLFFLTLWLILRCLVYLLPTLGLIAGIAWLLMSDHDINYYLTYRPREFYYAVAASVGLGLGLAWLLGRKMLGWSLALPLALFGNVTPRLAFKVSAKLTVVNRHAILRAFFHLVIGIHRAVACAAALPGRSYSMVFQWRTPGIDPNATGPRRNRDNMVHTEFFCQRFGRGHIHFSGGGYLPSAGSALTQAAGSAKNARGRTQKCVALEFQVYHSGSDGRRNARTAGRENVAGQCTTG